MKEVLGDEASIVDGGDVDGGDLPPESRAAAESGALVNLNKAQDKYVGR